MTPDSTDNTDSDGPVVSPRVRVKRPNTLRPELTLSVGDRVLTVLPTGRGRGRGRGRGDDLYLSERFEVESLPLECRLDLDARFDGRESVKLDILRWLPPE